MWTPTHVVVTVLRARNLLDKGKGGNDAYCMIGMGKEKFLTSVRAKTTSPVWDEQAEFELNERADLKLTVYHKSSIIDEFIGRVVINISEMVNDTNRSFTKWFKLQSKPDKADSKKPDKERGDIEVRVEFIIKPKTGSVMDLSYKNKEKSLSLKNLKDKSINIKHSLGDKLKILQKPRKPKFTGENQLAEQAKQMNGSKLDFLDGEDMGSLTSSYSSINGSTFSRYEDAKPANSMSRFNPTRSSFISRNSSTRMDNDTSSVNENSNPNDDDSASQNDANQQQDLDMNMNDLQSFNRNNSFRKSSLRRQSKRSMSYLQQTKEANENGAFTNPKNSSSVSTSLSSSSSSSADQSRLHIAPLPAFLNDGDEYSHDDEIHQRNQRYQVLSSIILEETVPPAVPQATNVSGSSSSPSNRANNDLHQTDSFASIFTASLANNDSTKPDVDSSSKNNRFSTPNSSHVINNINNNNNNNNNPFLLSSSKNSANDLLKIEALIVSTGPDEHETSAAINLTSDSKSRIDPSPKSLSNHSSMTTMVKSETVKNQLKSNSNYNNHDDDDDDDDQIDWASSEDEEIVKQEVETFERNQVKKEQANTTTSLSNNTNKSKKKKKKTDSSTIRERTQIVENKTNNDNNNTTTNNNNNNQQYTDFEVDLFKSLQEEKEKEHTTIPSQNNIPAGTSQQLFALEDLLGLETTTTTTIREQSPVVASITSNTSNSFQIDDFFINNNNPTTTNNKNKRTSTLNKSNNKLNKNFPLTSSFQIDIDPFSSSSSRASSNKSIDKLAEPQFDPFLDFLNTNTKMSDSSTANDNNNATDEKVLVKKSATIETVAADAGFDSNFSDLKFETDQQKSQADEINDIQWKMGNLEPVKEETNAKVNQVIAEDEEEQEQEAEPENTHNQTIVTDKHDSDSDSYEVPNPVPRSISQTNEPPASANQFSVDIKDPFEDEDAKNDDDENMDDMFKSFGKLTANLVNNDDDFGQKELNELRADLNGQLAEDESSNIDLAMRKGDLDLNTVYLTANLNDNNDDDDNETYDIENEKSLTISENVAGADGRASSSILNTESDASHNDVTHNNNFKPNTLLRQSERKRLMPTEDLTSDLNSETDFNTNVNTLGQQHGPLGSSTDRVGSFGSRGAIGGAGAGPGVYSRSNMQIDLNTREKSNLNDEIKTPDFDSNYAFQGDAYDNSKLNTSAKSDDNLNKGTNNGLPDLINQKDSNDKARKYLEGLDGVKFNEIQVPDSLKKQLEFFDRDELLQLIAYQKKYLDFKESRIKDLENYIDNLIVKIIETEPLILMNASNVLNKTRNVI